MKTKSAILLLLFISNSLVMNAQEVYTTKNLEAYVGVWKYQKNDTVFKIVFQKGQERSDDVIYNGLFGGYSLTVKGVVIEKYWKPLPNIWYFSQPRPRNMYIWATNATSVTQIIKPDFIGVIFYDQKKKHCEGKGITGGYIQLLSPDKIHWKLDEEQGIWNEYEGSDDWAYGRVKPIGFSVPDDVIMIREK